MNDIYYRRTIALNNETVNGLNSESISLIHLNLIGQLTYSPDLTRFINLRNLYIEHNDLQFLHVSIGNLINLENLCLCYNKLKFLPESIGNLQKLKCIQLKQNRLEFLPESIGNLKNLEEFVVDNNCLITLPSSFGNMSNLRRLCVRRNNLLSLPLSFGNLKYLIDFRFTSGYLYDYFINSNIVKKFRIYTLDGITEEYLNYNEEAQLLVKHYLKKQKDMIEYYIKYFILALNCSYPLMISLSYTFNKIPSFVEIEEPEILF
jgi:Leucine-rich repeat (LRR) protein